LPSGLASPLVIDVGTGTGCIACAIAWERPTARVIALEASPRAAAMARDNVAALGLLGRVTVEVSDLFCTLQSVRAHVVVSNPPYLPTDLIPTLSPEVSRHDPRIAMDGGPDGLSVLRRLVADAPAWLVPGGALVLETGGDAQVRDVVALMQAAGFTALETRRDLAGVERFVAGRRP
jgi:release factor glutamine methyltransferase